MANFCSGVKVRLFGGAAGSMSSSVTSSFWARSIKGVELVKVMVSVLPVSPWREERLRQVSHVSLTDREDGMSVIGECSASRFLHEHLKFTPEQEDALRALGWKDPVEGRTPNWHVEVTSDAEVLELGKISERTLLGVLGLGLRDRA